MTADRQIPPAEREDRLARGMAMLWGARDRPRRGPRPGLTLDAIVAAAIEIADTEGLAALSMRRVASQFGLTTMSVYRYVADKEELVEAMFDAAIDQSPPPVEDPAAWRENLAAWARGHYAIFRRRPWMFLAATGRRLMGPREIDWFEAGLRTLDGLGMSYPEMLDNVGAINGYVRGMAQTAADAASAERATGVSDGNWRAHSYEQVLTYAGRDRLPLLAAMVDSGAFDDHEAHQAPDDQSPDAFFEAGLARMLDGIEVRLTQLADTE